MEVISMSWTILTSSISSITTRCSKGQRLLSHEKISALVEKSHRPDAKETPSDTTAVGPENLNQACSFPVETEQHELDPDGTRADEMVTDEVPLDDENGGDSETIVRKPLTSSQKKGYSEYP